MSMKQVETAISEVLVEPSDDLRSRVLNIVTSAHEHEQAAWLPAIAALVIAIGVMAVPGALAFVRSILDVPNTVVVYSDEGMVATGSLSEVEALRQLSSPGVLPDGYEVVQFKETGDLLSWRPDTIASSDVLIQFRRKTDGAAIIVYQTVNPGEVVALRHRIQRERMRAQATDLAINSDGREAILMPLEDAGDAGVLLMWESDRTTVMTVAATHETRRIVEHIAEQLGW
jgi:hypothetical protein